MRLYVEATPEQKAQGAAYYRPSDGVLIDIRGHAVQPGTSQPLNEEKSSPNPWPFKGVVK